MLLLTNWLGSAIIQKRDAFTMLDLDALHRSEDVRDDFNDYIKAVLVKMSVQDELMQHMEDGRDGESILPDSMMGNVQQDLPSPPVIPSEHFELLKKVITEAAEDTLKLRAPEQASRGYAA